MRGPRAILEVAADLGLPPAELRPYGREVAKVPVALVRALADRPRRGKLVLVSAMTPTKHGEGKTLTAVGTTMALRAAGHRAVACLRQPSLGPVFGIKGGATGGGKATVEPSARINLGLTGDIDAVAAAHNLLAALVDNHVYFGNSLGIDPATVSWPRTLDVNDRALRDLTYGRAGDPRQPERHARFVIAAASEVMAVLGLARDYADLKARLGRILLARRRDGSPVRAQDLRAAGALAVLLRDALEPNLLQTSDGTPAIVHGGPFGNIAHGTCSRLAIELGLASADLVVVEAGFATELGAEKFVDLVAPTIGVEVSAAIVVATVQALRRQGGVEDDRLGAPDLDATGRGLENLAQHLDNVSAYGVPPVVALNRFPGDSDGELERVRRFCRDRSVPCAVSTPYTDGAAGARELAELVVEAVGRGATARPVYPAGASMEEKLTTVVTRLYGGSPPTIAPGAAAELERLVELGEGGGPICVAKTPLSLSDDPKRLGRPRDFTPTLRRVSRSAGAGFTVAYLGDIETLPGLPRHPLAEEMDVTDDGRIVGVQ